MSPWSYCHVLRSLRFPRVSGDEPPDEHTRFSTAPFSPRERG